MVVRPSSGGFVFVCFCFIGRRIILRLEKTCSPNTCHAGPDPPHPYFAAFAPPPPRSLKAGPQLSGKFCMSARSHIFFRQRDPPISTRSKIANHPRKIAQSPTLNAPPRRNPPLCRDSITLPRFPSCRNSICLVPRLHRGTHLSAQLPLRRGRAMEGPGQGRAEMEFRHEA